MDNMPTKKKRGRPSKGVDYGKVTARLTEEQYSALIDYGHKHNIVDKNGVNTSAVIRSMIDNQLMTVDGMQARITRHEVERMQDAVGSAILILRELQTEDEEDKVWLLDLADKNLAVYDFLSSLLP